VKRIGRVYPRRNHFDIYAAGRVRAWHWRYWPDRCQLIASTRIGKCSPGEAVLMLLAVEKDQMAKRINVTATGLPSLEPLASGGKWQAELPALTSFLIDNHYDDGTTREPGKLFIAIERGMWVGTVKDPNQALELAVVVELPEQVLAALDAAIASPTAPWRVDKWAAARLKKPKK